MGPTQPSSRVRPGGGFNTGGMGMFDENLEKNATQAAMQQKALGQQQAAVGASPAAAAAAQNPLAAMQQAAGGGADQAAQPRDVGTIKEELLERPVVDIAKGLGEFFDLNKLLGINPQTDTPEQQAKKKQLHKRFQDLDAEQQKIAQENYQREMAIKKQKMEQEEQQKQQKAQQAEQSVVVPSSTQKGPVGPGGSKKQSAINKMQQDRKTLGGPASAN